MNSIMIISAIYESLALADSLGKMLRDMKEVSTEDTAMINSKIKEYQAKYSKLWEKGDHLK